VKGGEGGHFFFVWSGGSL